MKIAISSVGKTQDSNLSEVSGRAPYYLIFEDEKLVEVVSNPFRVGGGGAGFAVAQLLADKGVSMVVSGRIGFNMRSALESNGIKVKETLVKPVKAVVEEVSNVKAKTL